jgi:type I restriction enzyme S subunit
MGITSSINLDLTPEQKKTVISLLQRYLPNVEVWAYGSRARWNARPDSDLDLVAFAKLEQMPSVYALKEDFEESNLPFRVDLFVWDKIPESFHAAIHKEKVVVQAAASEMNESSGGGVLVWKKEELGKYCQKIGSGATPRGGSEVYLDKGEFVLIRSQNIYNDGFKEQGLAFIDNKAAEKLRNVEVLQNDILLNITGDSVARVCLAPNKFLPARVNQHVAIIRTDPNEFNPHFVRYFLILPEMQHVLLALASSGATRNALTKSMIESLKIPKPDLSIQKSISDILLSLDNKIAINQQITQTLEAMAQALFKSWFVDFEPTRAKIAALDAGGTAEDATLAAMTSISGKTAEELAALKTTHPETFAKLHATATLFPSRLVESELGEIPEGWEVSNFGVVSECFDRLRIPLSSREREKRQGNIPYYGATSVMDYVDEPIFDGIYLLLGEDGSVLKEDGTPFTQYIWGKSWVNNHAHVLLGKGSISTEQLYLFINRTNIAAYVTGAVQLKLNQKNMNSIPFIKAADEINKKFGEKITSFFEAYRAITEENKNLTQLRDSLLPKLLSGEIEVSMAANTTEAA